MNVKVCRDTLKKRISENAPVFHDFMKKRRIYGGLTDAIIVNTDGSDEPSVITSHSENAPFEYYEWRKRGTTYYPRPVSQVTINKMLTINCRRKK